MMKRVTASVVALGALALASPAAIAWADGQKKESYGVDSVVFGVLDHDIGLFGNSKEAGVDFNLELRFDKLSGGLWDYLLGPQPHLGLSVNSDGDTSQGYFGLTWLFDIGGGLFGGGSLGGAVHNGELATNAADEKSLGSRVLFRESIELGYRIAERHSLSLMLDHISNADLADHNEGLDNFGIRYALRL